MQQVWKLCGASLRVQECKAKGLNAAPTWPVKESQYSFLSLPAAQIPAGIVFPEVYLQDAM